MAVSKKFLILWVFSACALVRLYFLIGRDGLPLFSVQSWKPPYTSGDGAAHDPEIPHGDNPNPPVPDAGKGLAEALPDGAVPAVGHDEGAADGKGPSQAPESGATGTTPDDTGLTISLVETGGSHDEVTSALVYAFASQKDAAITIYSPALRYGIKTILDDFKLPVVINSTDNFKKAVRQSAPPKVLISTTCELDMVRLAKSFDILLAGEKTYLFCVIHHADRWTKSDFATNVRPWIEKGLVDFVALSEHTAHFLQTEAIDKWDYKAVVKVQVLPPVFPVNLPEPLAASDPNNKFSLAMQGDYDASRRDYKGIFQHLVEIMGDSGKASEGAKPSDVALHLIGHGKRPEVPDNVKEQTVFDESLSYMDFYTILSRSFALLPAFASKEYFDRKASSSVPASIIGGVPLVASEQLLKSYSYLPREAAWISKPDEGEMDVIKRVRKQADERKKKGDIIKATRERLIKENIEHVSGWLEYGLKRAGHTL